MKVKPRQCGLTLMEMTVVVAVIAMLTVFGLPAIRALINSFESQGSTRAMISAALSSARAIAAKEQHYAGIRFQHAYDPQGLLNAPQYMIFIVHDTDPSPNGTDLANGFRAVEGINPIRLPGSVGVMDLRYRTNPDPRHSGDEPIDEDNDIDEPNEVRDTTTFSVIFSPSGKMVIHDVRVRNRDGIASGTSSEDDIFNTEFNVEDEEIAMFYQDDYTDLGLGQETSRNCFIIYDRIRFRQVYETGLAYSEYLEDLANSMIYINPYTGTMINR